MTDANSETPARQSEMAPESGSYQTLAALRDAHFALTRSISGSSEQGSASVRERVRAFLIDAPNTGAFLADPKERRAAQGILDYWSAELASRPGATSDDFAPVLLAPFDEGRTRREGDQPPETDKSDQRALIRFSAFAREWNASGRHPGYLLTGDAIKQAARFRDLDSGIEDFVAASEEVAEARKRRWLYWMYGGGVISAALVLIIGYLFWQFLILPTTREFKVVALTTDVAKQADALRWLHRYQPWLSPSDLSRAPLESITLTGLRLYAPNFAKASFKKVSLKGARLAGASFDQARFAFDGSSEDQNDFSGAVLSNANFREAKIAFTSFVGVDLYRAIFDRAVLCDVDFSGANLRSASFWGVSLNEKTKEHLKDTAWWHAEGWPWSEIETLAPPRGSAANRSQASEQDNARVARLKESRGFKTDVSYPMEQLKRAGTGTLERAVALNDLAWTLAIWGIDIAAPESTSPSDPCTAEGIPTNARHAAEQAVCIVRKLNSEGRDGAHAALLSSLQDTLAYILMQSGDVAAASKIFEEIAKDDSTFLESGEILFRSAVAQHAAGQDKLASIKNFRAAIAEKRYQPTHELQTLKDYIFTVREFVEPLKKSMDSLWPPVPRQGCPAPKPGPAR
jgi:Pentapeptide repeats (9 copies)/Pentapeptide repeats (8 copies)